VRIRSKGIGSMAKKYSCELCLKRFKNEAAFEDHKKSDKHLVMIESTKRLYEEIGKDGIDLRRIRAA
jgi:hypothetical protein